MKKALIIFFLFFSFNSTYASPKTISALEEGGKLIFIRHAYAPGGGDPDNLDIKDCSTQRNIDATGIEQAKRIGQFFRDNEIATFNLLNQLSEQCSNFIYASSQVVYGNVRSLDVKEDALLDVTESPYACSKVNCENWLRWFQKKTGGTYLSLRFCGFIDGGGLIDYILAMAIQGKEIELFSNGEIVRDYLSSDDATMAFCNAINCIASLGNEFIPINIGSGQTMSAMDIAELVCMAVNSDSTITRLDKNGPQGDFILNNRKARELLDFEPHSLVEEITKYSQIKRVSRDN